MPHKIQYDATQADNDKGFLICTTCEVRATVLSIGLDYDTWDQCDRCDSWTIETTEAIKREKLK